MGKLTGGIALILLALFMFLGFLRADVDAGAPATLVAVLLVIGLPALAGGALLMRHFGGDRELAERRDVLRRQTLEAEVLRLAQRHDGRLTVVEVMTEFAVDAETATSSLNALMSADHADIEVTDSGTLVYVFRDVRNLGEKPHSKGLLDG